MIYGDTHSLPERLRGTAATPFCPFCFLCCIKYFICVYNLRADDYEDETIKLFHITMHRTKQHKATLINHALWFYRLMIVSRVICLIWRFFSTQPLASSKWPFNCSWWCLFYRIYHKKKDLNIECLPSFLS